MENSNYSIYLVKVLLFSKHEHVVHGAKKNIKTYLAFDHIICVSKRLAQIVGQPHKVALLFVQDVYLHK
jgi:hypothetical protein